jgi:hypothetical protein
MNFETEGENVERQRNPYALESQDVMLFMEFFVHTAPGTLDTYLLVLEPSFGRMQINCNDNPK